MTESAFHDKVLDGLRALEVAQMATTTEVKNIVARLDITNGRIAAQERKTGDMQIELAERRLNCPIVANVQDALGSRLDAAEEFITTEKAKKSEDKNWMNRLWPIIYAAAGIAFYMVLLNAKDVIAAMHLKHVG